jgi:hypothetical protein
MSGLTFEKYWAAYWAQYKQGPAAKIESVFKDVAKKAWNAACLEMARR